jgi:hypothetical protein
MPTFGPGTLQIGATGSEIDASCQVNSLRIATSKDEGDSKTMLCGTVKAGKVTYTYTLSGNVDTDTDDAAGLFALSQSAAGTEQPFTFTPDTETGTTASGTLIIDPLDFGADEYGDDLNSDFEWTIVGAPSYDYGTEPVESSLYQVQNGRRAPGVRPEVKAPTVETTTAKAKATAGV